MEKGLIVLDCGFDVVEEAGTLACCYGVSSVFR
jgi:hypothetical protein